MADRSDLGRMRVIIVIHGANQWMIESEELEPPIRLRSLLIRRQKNVPAVTAVEKCAQTEIFGRDRGTKKLTKVLFDHQTPHVGSRGRLDRAFRVVVCKVIAQVNQKLGTARIAAAL